MSQKSLPTTVPVYFLHRDGDPHPEIVMHALRGVAASIYEMDMCRTMEQQDFERLGGLTCAAHILSAWLTDRFSCAPELDQSLRQLKERAEREGLTEQLREAVPA